MGCLEHLAYRPQDQIALLLPIICDRSLFHTSLLHFRMLPDVPNPFVRRAATNVLSAILTEGYCELS
jgi:hypothetical protein